MLELHRVDGFHGRAQALFGVSLNVRAGEAVALIGRNGAGKTTAMRTVMGLVRAKSGRILVDGQDVTGLPTQAIARLGIGYVPEDRRVFPDLTAAENLEVGRRPPRPGMRPWTDARVLALFPALAPLLGRRAGSLSGGEQQMLVVARTLLGNPRLLLLDEPSEGLAPIVVEHMAAALAALKREGLALLLSEQNLAFATAVADRAYLIEKGHVRDEAPMAKLAGDEAARRAWLGL
jgi:branched-chain amino acid transport system ATP-binding protein